MINEEIARLTGTLKFNVDARALNTFEKRLASVEGKLRAFSELANRKFNIKVTLDSKTLRAQLDKAMNAKVVFKNFSADMNNLALLQKIICEKLDRTPIRLNNIKINISEVLAQRALLRQQLGSVSVAAKVSLNFKEANASMRAWKAKTEQRFKLHLNADISMAKLYRNASATLKAVSAKLGTITLKTPQIKLSVDRAHLKAEIASVLAQIKRETRIKIDLNSRVTGSPRVRHASSGIGEGRGFGRFGGFGLPMGALGGLGAFAGLSHLNQINQQQQGQKMALMSVTGSAAAGAETKKRFDAMADDIGFNARKMLPSFTKMLASGKTSGFSQAQTEQVFKSMTEYGRVMGLGSEDMKGSLRAVEQMMNKTQIMSEELKGQLAERFPAAISLFAKSQDKTVPQLLKAMKDGKVSSQALLKFAEILSEEARKGGALDAAKRSTGAQQARMENAFSFGVEAFSAGGFDQASSNFFKTVADAADKNLPVFEALGKAFLMLTTPLNAVIKLLGDFGKILPSIASGLGLSTGQLIAIAATIGLALAPFGMFLIILGGIALAIQDIVGYTQGKDSLFGRFLAGSEDGTKAFDDLSASLKTFNTNLETALQGARDLGPLLKGLSFSDFLVNTMRELTAILDTFNSVVNRMVSAGYFAGQSTKGETGLSGLVMRNFRNIQGLIQGPEENQAWLERDAEFKRQRAFEALKVQPDQLDRSMGRKSVAPEDLYGENSPARRAMYAEANMNQVTIDRIQVDIHGDGVLTAGNIEGGLKTAIEDIAKQAFSKTMREASVGQQEAL